MGWLGMGITQSDDYDEVYSYFMEEYDKGKSVAEITEKIFTEYRGDLPDDSGAMHDVYFAVAKAQWMCCELSEALLEKVREIVENGSNLTYLREEYAVGESDLKLRQRNLLDFYAGLKKGKAFPRRRNALPKEKQLPRMNIGDCFAYKFEEGSRIGIILDNGHDALFGSMVFCCILKETFHGEHIEYLNCNMGLIGCYTAKCFLAKSNIRKIDNIPVPENLKIQVFGNYTPIGAKTDFYMDFSDKPSLRFSKLLEAHKGI